MLIGFKRGSFGENNFRFRGELSSAAVLERRRGDHLVLSSSLVLVPSSNFECLMGGGGKRLTPVKILLNLWVFMSCIVYLYL
jgi:hypothetical protein